MFGCSPGDLSIAVIIIYIWKINDIFPLIHCVYVWFNHWPLRVFLVFFLARELPCSCRFLFQIKEVNIENVSKPICVSKRPLRNSGLCCAWYAQRHLSLIYLFREEREGDGGWSAPGISAASMRYDAAWFWSLTFAFSCILKNKAFLPLRNYSNDLQQCMFSYSFVVGIWEHILTSQLLMQGSEWAQWMQSPCVQSSVTPNHRSSRTDTHNSDKSDRICIQRPQKKGINKKCTKRR